MADGKRIKGTDLNFDPEFRFLLEIDPAFEQWRVLAIEWCSTQKSARSKALSITAFFVSYLHKLQLDKNPVSLFEAGPRLPDLCETLGWKFYTSPSIVILHDHISDFLDWVLRSHLAETDAQGHRVVPPHLHHLFPRFRAQRTGKQADLSFAHVAIRDPRMQNWLVLAVEWLSQQKTSVAQCRYALDHFLVTYIIGCDLSRQPLDFLTRTTPKPLLPEILVKAKSRGDIGQLTDNEVRVNNHIADFLDWVLADKLSLEGDHGHRFIPHELHNPIARLTKSGIAMPTETVKAALSIRYIKELRTMLAEGPHFRDWIWGQKVTVGARGGDWFRVDPAMVNYDDPDCVWRKRNPTLYEQNTLKLIGKVTELWSPVRAVALYLKLELPLRTYQVRMLDSGEADTWRYEHVIQGGRFVLNDSPLATGSDTRPYQRGVFHRSANESGAGLFINTNKTADSSKPEYARGYLIPWAHEAVLYWLAKLRCWQERYNPISSPIAWTELEAKHFGRTPPHPEVLEGYGTTCFLFRNAAASDKISRQKPINNVALDHIWYLLLARLEQRCRARAETLDDGTPLQFINPVGYGTHFPLHALRVSLISYLVLDLQLPLAVVSKLIAGHARLIMTLYYTKFGHAYMKEILDTAERKTLATEEANHRRFLMDATMEQVSQRFASISVDAMHAAVGHQSAATFVFDDKGICPVGGSMCDVGGERIKDRQQDQIYAPVPGYPEHNCVRCRFFLSGPAFLPGLQAHFNSLSYKAHERAERHNALQEEVTLLENRRANCERQGRMFPETRELEKLSHSYEAEAEAMGKVINDLKATYYLIKRSLDILGSVNQEGIKLVAVGEMNDIQMGFTETKSELHQLEVLCENCIIYPEIDARKPSLRRAQLLDSMLAFNKMPPIFFRLTPQQQLEAGNAVMQLIQARTGSLKGALEFVECQRSLREIGLIEETWDVLAEQVCGTPARQLVDAARTILHDGDSHAS
ncbi:gamma-mobile-trio integrase GmtZ [Aeromonas hydrophila]